jgi:hypothetical protein
LQGNKYFYEHPLFQVKAECVVQSFGKTELIAPTI